MIEASWSDHHPMPGRNSIRHKRQTAPEGTIRIYAVTSNGGDISACLSYETTNMSCATIAYIIGKDCSRYAELYINVFGNISQPCAVSDTSFTASCSISIKGYRTETDGVISSQWASATNLSDCLLLPVPISCVSQPTLCSSSVLAKFQASDLTFRNLILDITGYNNSFRNVIFDHAKLISNTNITQDCSLFCHNCDFIFYLEDLREITNSTNETVSYLPYAINLLQCMNTTIMLCNTEFVSSGLQVTFYFGMNLQLKNSTIRGNQEYNVGGSRIYLQQINDTFNDLESQVSHEISVELIGMSILENQLEVNESASNAIVGIYLFDDIEKSVTILMHDIVASGNTAILEYDVESINSSMTSFSTYQITLYNLIVYENTGFSNVFRISQRVEGDIVIHNLTFYDNKLYDPTVKEFELDRFNNVLHKTSALSVNLSTGTLNITNSSFYRNTGALGGGFHFIKTSFSVVTFSMTGCNFINNSAVVHTGQVSGFGGAFTIQSNFLTVSIQNCLFSGNNAEKSGGAGFIESLIGLESTSHFAMPQRISTTTTSKPTEDVQDFGPIFSANLTGEIVNDTYWYFNVTRNASQSCQLVCLKGYKGPIGLPGDPGQTGHRGPAGPPGSIGPPGPSGRKGQKGQQGLPGKPATIESTRRKRSVGFESKISNHRQKRDINLVIETCPNDTKYEGKCCVRGPRGPIGEKGDIGEPGPPGRSGFPGYVGEQGPSGYPGGTGAVGATGADGQVIIDGATQSARKKRSVHVPHSNEDCPSGDPGPKGPLGPSGLPGLLGSRGSMGPRGDMGPRGEQGDTGAPGDPGKNIVLINGSHMPEVPISPPNTTLLPEEKLFDSPNRLNVNISFSQFIQNKAVEVGGGLTFSRIFGYFIFTLGAIDFEANQAGQEGGGLVIRGDGKTEAVWSSCNFRKNGFDDGLPSTTGIPWDPHIRGGAFYTNQSIALQIYNNSFSQNSAKALGGALIFTSAMTILNVDQTVFTRNMAIFGKGGAISLFHSGFTSINTKKVILNVILKECLFDRNVATQNGGAFSVEITHQSKDSQIQLQFLEGTKFVDNSANSTAGALYFQINLHRGENDQNIYLESCIFISNWAQHQSGAIHFDIYLGSSNMNITGNNLSFTGNSAGVSGAAGGLNLYWKSMFEDGKQVFPERLFGIRFIHCDFIRNIQQTDSDRSDAGGALFINIWQQFFSAKVLIELFNLTVINNTGKDNGGAFALNIGQAGSTVRIIDCKFLMNAAGKLSKGGAIYIFLKDLTTLFGSTYWYMPLDLVFKDLTFIDNMAGEGGSLFQTGSKPNNSTLYLENIQISCCESSKAFSKNGTLLVTSIATSMKDVSFFEVADKHQASICPIAGLVLNYQEIPHELSNVNYKCQSLYTYLELGKYLPIVSENFSETISVGQPSGNDSSLHSFMVYCTDCRYLPHAVGDGIFNIDTKPIHKTTRDIYHEQSVQLGHYINLVNPCRPCPFGADCSEGDVVARANFWGFEYDDSLSFQTCPLGYCCNNVNIPCRAHNTCAEHRDGRLCGKCRDKYSESVMSRKCVPNESCNDWWVWPLGMILAISYLIWYMYKSEVLPGFEFVMIKIASYSTLKSSSQKRAGDNFAVQNKEDKNNQAGKFSKIKKERVDKGYFDIMVYFVNIISLLKVQVEFKSSSSQHDFFYDFERYFTRYVDVDMQQVSTFSVCPFPGVGAITKSLARPGFVLMILFVWVMGYTFAMMLQQIFKPRKTFAQKFYSLRLKLIEGYVETMKYSYSGLAGVTFLFLTCIEIGDDSFWKYNASIKCFSEWQHAVIVFAVIYTVPFSVATIVGIKLLKKRYIGHIQFMLACLLPLPFLIMWMLALILKSVSPNKTKSKIPNNGDDVNMLFEDLDDKSQVILDTFQGPYKDEMSFWEGIIELRKLLFNTYFLIPNNIYRLVLCTFTAVSVLVHHSLVKPFKNENSNRVETLSLALHTMACVTNSVKTVFTESGIVIDPNTPTEQLLSIMVRIDRSMILVLVAYIIASELHCAVKEQKHKQNLQYLAQ